MSSVPESAVADILAHGWTAGLAAADVAALGVGALDAARRVFALPPERKAAFVDPTGAGDAGWRAVVDTRERPEEVWQLGGELPDLWPEELAADRALILRLRARCVELVAELLDAVAPALAGTPAELTGGVVNEDRSVVRLLRYDRRAGDVGFSPHTDFGIATFFAAQSVPLLELRDAAGRWRGIDTPCALAAGEMLAARTGDAIPAGVHRVRSVHRERWSVAVFVHPDPAYRLTVADDGSPVTARGFFQHTMKRRVGRPARGA